MKIYILEWTDKEGVHIEIKSKEKEFIQNWKMWITAEIYGYSIELPEIKQIEE